MGQKRHFRCEPFTSGLQSAPDMSPQPTLTARSVGEINQQMRNARTIG
jgi:hypothetical protein